MNNHPILPSRRATLLFSSLLMLGVTGLACDRGDSPDERSAAEERCGCDDCCDDSGESGATSGGVETDGSDGCTLTQGYWKNHSEYAKNPSQHAPWPIAEDTPLCGSTWYEILGEAPKGDAWYILAHQWIAASLNVAAGADAPPDVVAALATAATYLEDCSISADEHDAALAASELLDAFNNGDVGPGHCGEGSGDATTGDDTTGATTTGDDRGETSGDDTTGWPIPG